MAVLDGKHAVGLQAVSYTHLDVYKRQGKRYRRQDEIGTPMCITVDFDTLETGVVTVRDRDVYKRQAV